MKAWLAISVQLNQFDCVTLTCYWRKRKKNPFIINRHASLSLSQLPYCLISRLCSPRAAEPLAQSKRSFHSVDMSQVIFIIRRHHLILLVVSPNFLWKVLNDWCFLVFSNMVSVYLDSVDKLTIRSIFNVILSCFVIFQVDNRNPSAAKRARTDGMLVITSDVPWFCFYVS